MIDFRSTKTWQSSLAAKDQDKFSDEREMLRVSFLSARVKASLLVQEISTDLPDFTIHDITHLDALWEYCDIIVGDSVKLNPVETYVLGLSFLVHDAGMTLSSYRNGFDDIKRSDIWMDLCALLKKDPSWVGLRDEREIEKLATAEVLRLRHAEKAGELVSQYWVDRKGSQIYIIEDEKIRGSLSEAIGSIAKSHWDSIEKIHQELNKISGAPSYLPPEWTCDLLKIACVLRACDVAHLDSRRAPYFTQLFRTLPPTSKSHWIFQEILNRPTLAGDRLSYTGSRRFDQTESDAWWLCFDTLRYVDAELRSTDALLADTRTDCRLAARGVSNVETSTLMEKSVGTKGWVPIDATIKISNVPKIVSILGGRGLYGDNPYVALRELIQNSCDAVRARRILEGRSEDWGTVKVLAGVKNGRKFISVSDDGIGMSLDTITLKLLDFGSSYWDSSLSYIELPGLHTKGYRSTGKFGIGFFSTFMLGEEVVVFTRRPYASLSNTIELQFHSGANSRPFIKMADKTNVLNDPGTSILIYLSEDVSRKIWNDDKEYNGNFIDKVEEIACACDVNIDVADDILGESTKVSANSWKTLTRSEIVKRSGISYLEIGKAKHRQDIISGLESRAGRARQVISPEGEVLGFGFIDPGEDRFFLAPHVDGVVTVGGLRAEILRGFAGLFSGVTDSISRDMAFLKGSRADYNSWLDEQIGMLTRENTSFVQQVNLCEFLLKIGFFKSNMPYVGTSGNPLSMDEFRSAIAAMKEIKIIDDYFITKMESNLLQVSDAPKGSKIVLDENVFSIRMGAQPIFPKSNRFDKKIWEVDAPEEKATDLFGWSLVAVAEVWGLPGEINLVDRRESDTRIGTFAGKVIKDGCFVLNKRKLQALKPDD